MTANFDDLGASLDKCVQALVDAQGSINVTRDRADSASRILANTADGSRNELLAEAMGICARVDQVLEEQIGQYALVLEKVLQYKATKVG